MLPRDVAFYLPFVIPLIALVPLMIVITRQQHVRFIETFGRYTSTRGAGLSIKLPWPIQIATRNFSLQVMELEQDVTVKSRDNAFVTVPIRVQYQVNPDTAADAYYKLSDAAGQIKSYVVNQIRSTASGQTFDDLYSSKEEFESDVQTTLEERLGSYGFRIVNVLVDDPQPSEELRVAFDRVLASQRLREAAENEGEAKRILRIKEAEAEKDSLRLKAEGFAEFRKIVAEGNAEAISLFRRDTGLEAADALKFFLHINEMDALRDAAAQGGKTVLVTGGKIEAGLF